MSRVVSDRLLSVTNALLGVLSGLALALAALSLVLGLAGLIFGFHTSPYAVADAADGATPLGVLAVAPPLAIYGWFLRTLRQIVRSVAAGTPFAAINADRLMRMGWLAVLLKVVTQVEAAFATTDMMRFASHMSGPDLVMILVLFVLARVFREGAAMRDDLEGTV